jgi:mono/diheme cytochrome c family protein
LDESFRLRRLPFSLRLAVACLVLCFAIGEAASLVHLVDHHENRDEQKGLSFLDVEAAYAGATIPSKLRSVLAAPHGREHLPDSKQLAALEHWLAGSSIEKDYDDEDRLGDATPALILEARCTSCHAPQPKDVAGAKGVASALPLSNWDGVKKVAFSHELTPADRKILVASTHAHALTLPIVALAVGLLALATSWPRRLVRAIVALGALGLALDLASWWLARPDFLTGVLPRDRTFFVGLIVGGGSAFAVALALAMALVVVDLLMPAPRAANAKP